MRCLFSQPSLILPREQIGSAFYRQAKGIPQGSVVSTYLCSLLYADMERKHLAFTQASDSVRHSCLISLDRPTWMLTCCLAVP
jgi:hypothetical protein